MSPETFASVVNLYLPEPHASLLKGIILGIPFHSQKEFYTELKIIGIVHIVVLSGTNISILASMVTQLTLFLGRKLSSLITIILICFFVGFVGVQAPTLRAAIMSSLTLVSVISGRKSMPLYTLFLTALISLLLRPNWLHSVSFQLSYASTLGLILFGKGSGEKTKDTSPGIIDYVKTDLRTSMSAQIFSLPIIYTTFHQISLISPLANVLVSWLIVPVMVFGILTVLLGKIHFLLGLLPSYIVYILLSYIIAVTNILSHLSFASLKF
jgi:competence protein ComEC